MVPCTRERNLAFNGTWFIKYISEDLGKVRDCYIANVRENGEVVNNESTKNTFVHV